DGANGEDATPGDNTAVDTDILNAAPDLTVSKSDGVTTTTPGSTLSYVINYSNDGNQAADNVVITETVPANTSFNAGASTAGWVDQGGGVYTFAISSVAAGASGSVTFAVTVDSTVPSGVTGISNTTTIADDGN